MWVLFYLLCTFFVNIVTYPSFKFNERVKNNYNSKWFNVTDFIFGVLFIIFFFNKSYQTFVVSKLIEIVEMWINDLYCLRFCVSPFLQQIV